MAAGDAATESIFFITAVVLATAAVGLFGGITNKVSDDMRMQGDRASDQLRTDITIINDPAVIATSPALIIYVKNTGTFNFDPNQMELLIDGVPQTGMVYDVLGRTDDNTFRPGEVCQISKTTTISNGDHKVRVVTPNGVADDLDFLK
jgi:archaeal flagellar protein FlaG